MTENEISNRIIGIAIEVHKALGPGLAFEGIKLDCGYRIDLLVDDKLVIELKSVEELSDVHIAQTLTYLKLGNYKLGLLINLMLYS